MYQYSNSLIRQFPSLVTGNAAVGVQATVYVGETNTLAQLFAVNGAAKSNPVTTDAKGFYSFSLADGDYRIVFSSSQFATLRISVLDGAQIREDFESISGEFDALVASNTAFRNEQQAAYDAFVLSQGWDQVGTFAAGFTYTSPNQVGQDADGNWWRWNGALPKTVTAGTLPSSDANYKLVGDGVLRNDLAAADSPVLVGGQTAANVGLYTGRMILRNEVWATDFGADPTGTNDSSLAINRATKYLSSIGGGTVLYPTGTLLLDRAIRLDDYDVETFTYSGNVRRNITHKGAGKDSTILKANSFWANIFSSFPEPFIAREDILPQLKDPGQVGASEDEFIAENIVICDMTLDCNYDVLPDGGATYGPNYETWGGTWPDGSSGASLWAADNYQYPIYAFQCKGVKVQNCVIKNSWFNGAEIYRCHDIDVLSNLFKNCGDKLNYLGYYSCLQLDNATYNVIVDGNRFKDCGNGIQSNGDNLTYAWRAVSNVIICNNIFDGTIENGVYAYDWIQGWTLHDNIYSNIGLSPIQITTNHSPVAGRQPYGCKVHHETINDFNGRNVAGTVGIRAIGSGHDVDYNTIKLLGDIPNANTWAIVVSDPDVANPTGTTYIGSVNGNTLIGRFPADSSTSGGGINISARNYSAIGNKISSTANVAQAAILINADDVRVLDNDIYGDWISGKRAIFHNSGVRSYVRDSKYSPMLSIRTAVGDAGLTGWNVVDFNGSSPVVTDNRDNFSAGNTLVADVDGLYEFSAKVIFNGVGTTAAAVDVMAIFERNGATSFGSSSALSVGKVSLCLSCQIPLNKGDAVSLKVNAASGTYTVEADTSLDVRVVQPLRP